MVVTGGSPGAYDGSKYCSTSRNGGVGNPRAFFASQTVPGDTIHMESALYVPVGADAALILENDTSTFYRALGRITGGSYYNYSGSTYVYTGLSYVADQWQTWEVEYVIGETVYTVRVGGDSVTVPSLDGLTTPGGGSLRAVSFGHNALETIWIDGVPDGPPPPPENDLCANATVLADRTLSGTIVSATGDGGAACGGSAGHPDVWYTYTATAAGTLIVDTCGSDFDTVVSVHQDNCPGTSVNEIACSDDCPGSSPCNTPRSCVTVPVSAGETYLIRVAGAGGQVGAYEITAQEVTTFHVGWEVGPLLPQGLQDSAGGVIHNTLISVGGFCSGIPGDQAIKPGVYPRGFLRKTWGLDLADREAGWAELPDRPGMARQGLFAAVLEDELYVWGGFNYTPPYTYSDGWRLSRSGSVWQWDALPGLPWRITSAGAAVIGTRIYVFGGADYDGVTQFYTDTDRYGNLPRLGARLLMLDTQNLQAGWQELPECPGTPRFVHAVAAVRGKLYVIGGATGESPSCTVVDNWVYDPPSQTWSRLADLPISSGNFPAGSIAYAGRYIPLLGGYDYGCVRNPDGTTGPPYGTPSSHPDQPFLHGVFYNDAFVYDTMTDTFSRTDKLIYNNNLPMTVVHGEEFFLIGGETGGVEIDGVYYGHHPELCIVGQIEPVALCLRSDFDRDGDVDLVDFGPIQACFESTGSLPPECDAADLDRDQNVSLADFVLFETCFSGP
jgi:hypothetical protein